MNNQENGGWEQVPVSQIKEDLLMSVEDSNSNNDPEFFSLLNRLIFNEYKEVGYYFIETSEGPKPEDIPTKWSLVYDSSPLHGLRLTPANEYSLLKVASSNGHLYFAISAFGSTFASALTEYVKVPYSPPELVSRPR